MSSAAMSIQDARAIAFGAAPKQTQSDFAPLMRDAGHAEALESEETLRESAKQLVASALIVPVLESMQKDSMAAEPFAPGTAEKRFSPLLHWQIADRVTEASNFPLIDAVVARFRASAAFDASSSPSLRGAAQPYLPLQNLDSMRTIDFRG